MVVLLSSIWLATQAVVRGYSVNYWTVALGPNQLMPRCVAEPYPSLVVA